MEEEEEKGEGRVWSEDMERNGGKGFMVFLRCWIGGSDF